MKNRHVPMLVAVSCLAAATTATAQSLTGTVTHEETPIRGIQVTAFDVVSAERLAGATTDFDGNYDTGTIPAGQYRVRFSDPEGVGAPGVYVSEFFGAGGSDEFCLAQVVQVLSSQVTAVDEDLAHSGPIHVVTLSGAISGHVSDAATGASLAGIQVAVLDARHGEVFATALTDSQGDYGIRLAQTRHARARVKFSDSEANYLPEFFGAGGRDVFCDATELDVGSANEGVDAALGLLEPGHQAQDLTDTIEAFDLPANVEQSLATPLNRLVDLITDDNPDNDAGACGQLTAFASRVDVQQARGQLSPAEADELRRLTASLQDALECM